MALKFEMAELFIKAELWMIKRSLQDVKLDVAYSYLSKDGQQMFDVIAGILEDPYALAACHTPLSTLVEIAQRREYISSGRDEKDVAGVLKDEFGLDIYEDIEELSMLADIQDIHDSKDPDQWLRELRRVEQEYFDGGLERADYIRAGYAVPPHKCGKIRGSYASI